MNRSHRQSCGPEARPWVERLVQAEGIRLDEWQTGWWSFHWEDFFHTCRRRGERVDEKVLARGFFEELSHQEPPVASFRIDQTRQALTVFVRGIENWHWNRMDSSGWTPRFRLKSARGRPGRRGPTSPAPGDGGPLVDRSDWEERKNVSHSRRAGSIPIHQVRRTRASLLHPYKLQRLKSDTFLRLGFLDTTDATPQKLPN